MISMTVRDQVVPFVDCILHNIRPYNDQHTRFQNNEQRK